MIMHWVSFFSMRVISHSHLHLPDRIHEVHDKHSGHWISDFPKTTAILLSIFIVLWMVALFASVDVGVIPGRWFLFR